MLGTLTAAFFTGSPGIAAGAAPDARILAVRTEPDDTEPGAQSFYNDQNTALRIEAEGIRYAAGHGAQVILLDYGSQEGPSLDLQSAVSYALSRKVVIVAPAFPTTGSHSSAYEYPQGFPGVVGVSPVMLPGGNAPSDPIERAEQQHRAHLRPGRRRACLGHRWSCKTSGARRAT